MTAKHIISSFICLIFLTGTALAQAMSQDEIEQAIELMRKSGTPEETIKQFLESMAQANAYQEKVQSFQQEGMSEEEASMRASGMDEDSISAIQGLTGLLGQLDAASNARKLKSEIAEFESTHADKNDVSVSIGTLVYELKLLACDYRDDTYSITAGGPPRETGEDGETLRISRSGPFAAGDNGQVYYIEGVNFQAPEIEFFADTIEVPFDGKTFSYSGDTKPTSGDAEPQVFQINFDCS